MPEQRVNLAGIIIDLFDEEYAVAYILKHAATETNQSGPAPISVVSANLDHIAQFGRGSRWEGTLGDSLHPTITYEPHGKEQMDWLTLLDGAPLVTKMDRITGGAWPRLAGSDLIGPLLDGASDTGAICRLFGRCSFHTRKTVTRACSITPLWPLMTGATSHRFGCDSTTQNKRDLEHMCENMAGCQKRRHNSFTYGRIWPASPCASAYSPTHQ